MYACDLACVQEEERRYIRTTTLTRRRQMIDQSLTSGQQTVQKVMTHLSYPRYNPRDVKTFWWRGGGGPVSTFAPSPYDSHVLHSHAMLGKSPPDMLYTPFLPAAYWFCEHGGFNS